MGGWVQTVGKRLSLVLWLLLAAVGVSTTTASASTHAYDGATVARAGLDVSEVGSTLPQSVNDLLAWSASASVEAIGRSTTPFRSLVATNTAPNPYGKAGGPAHQAGVRNVVDDISSRGLIARQEVRFDTPGGFKDRRFADVGAYDADGNLVEIHQVGRQTKGGLPVKRERAALVDIMNNNPGNASVFFHPYN
jgi:hypothetical protein